MTEGARKQGREVGGVIIRSASWLAWSLCALSLSLTALGYLVIALNLSLDAPVYFYWLEPTTIAIGYSVIGAIIASRLPGHPIGWICCAIGFVGAVEHFSSEYAIYALLAHPEALAGGNVMLWLCNWVWIVMFGLIVYLILLFPNGRLPSSRWRWFAWLSVALTLLAATLMAISPDAVLDVLGSSANAHISFPNPLGIEGLPNLYRPVQTLVLTLGLVGAASVVVGRRGARGVERQQMKWLLYASAMFFVGNVLKNTVFSPFRRGVVGLVGWLLACGGWWLGRSHRNRDSHPALSPLRDRHPNKPHPRLWLPHRHASRNLLWCGGWGTGDLPSPHRPGGRIPTRHRRLDACDRGPLRSSEASDPVLHRSSLLPKKVRRCKDSGSLLREAA